MTIEKELFDMRNLRVLGLALLALFAVSAVASASASAALPQVLVGGVASAATFKGTSSETPILETLALTKIVCEKSTSTTEIGANGESGTFHATFSGNCHKTFLGSTFVCTGLGDTTSGTILELGKIKFVYDKIAAPLGVAAHLTLEPTVHFECVLGTTKILVLLSGDMLCLVSPINTLSESSTLVCEQSKGDAKETEYWETSTQEKPSKTALVTATSEGTGESSALETTENLKWFVGGVAKAVELMG